MEWSSELGLLLRGLLIGIAVAAPVGPVNVLCMQRTLAHGARNGFVSGLGAAAADALGGAIAAFGLTAVADFLIGQQYWMRALGGTFLLGLGAKIFLSRPRGRGEEQRDSNLGRAVGTTFLLTITNPMTILAFVAIFAGAGLARADGDFVGAAVLVLGVFLGSALWWLALSAFVARVRHKLDDRAMAWINRGSGALIFAFGLAAWASLATLG